MAKQRRCTICHATCEFTPDGKRLPHMTLRGGQCGSIIERVVAAVTPTRKTSPVIRLFDAHGGIVADITQDAKPPMIQWVATTWAGSMILDETSRLFHRVGVETVKDDDGNEETYERYNEGSRILGDV